MDSEMRRLMLSITMISSTSRATGQHSMILVPDFQEFGLTIKMILSQLVIGKEPSLSKGSHLCLKEIRMADSGRTVMDYITRRPMLSSITISNNLRAMDQHSMK